METESAVTEPVETESVESESAETESVETVTADTASVETESVEKASADAKSAETESVEIKPMEKASAVTESDRFSLWWNPAHWASMAAGIILAALLSGFALLSVLLTSSAIKEDLFYFVLVNVFGFSIENAVLLENGLQNGFWHVLNQFSGGFYQGSYYEGDRAVFSFGFHFPVLAALLFECLWIILLLALLNRFYDHRKLQSFWHKMLSVLLMYTVFSVSYLIVLAAAKPAARLDTDFTDTGIVLHIPYGKVLVTLFVVFVLSACVVFAPWRKLVPLRRMLTALGALYIFIAAVFGTTWSLSPHTDSGQSHLLTFKELWQQYPGDPLGIALLGNMLVQSQMYALGGTWNVEGELLPQMMKAPGSFRINWFAGMRGVPDPGMYEVNIAESEETQQTWKSELARSMRETWYPLAMLLIFLYGVSRLVSSSWLQGAMGVLIVSLLFAVAAEFLTVRLQILPDQSDLVIEERIGFDAIQTGLATLLTALAGYILVMLVSRLMTERVKGGANG
ncbi:hypothetical protein ABEV74_14520 [Paenibacillus cisolokensis]|uniref:hypothetical protein n=1 Tax=Paenibacillus cisolokensis TaxID=1658519 RepID=UPI003D2E2DBE